MISEYVEHARNFKYMSGIERDTLRTKQTAEVFTPTKLVQEILDNMNQSIFEDSEKTFLDNSCGDGQILTEITITKLQRSKCTLKQALLTIYGVDLMEDNIEICKKRLAGPNPTQEILDILDNNVVCADALEYNYSFGEPVGFEKFY
tara:strand:+ start:3262 stop:3702 length:441 start_codon:yes stop_codon:yes gene_type:complete